MQPYQCRIWVRVRVRVTVSIEVQPYQCRIWVRVRVTVRVNIEVQPYQCRISVGDSTVETSHCILRSCEMNTVKHQPRRPLSLTLILTLLTIVLYLQ